MNSARSDLFLPFSSNKKIVETIFINDTVWELK